MYHAASRQVTSSFGRPGQAEAVLALSLEKAQLKVPLFWSGGVGFARTLAFLVSLLGAATSAAGAEQAIPSSAPEEAATSATASPAVRTYVGEKTCTQCHVVINEHFSHTVHAKTFRLNPRNELQGRVCEACHGPGSLHTQNPTDHTTLIGFTRRWGTAIDVMNGQCLQCHQGGQRIHWTGSIHQSSQLACSDCHNPMAKLSEEGLLRRESIIETCYSCHQQQRADFRKRSHMPLPEGKVSCEDCHNPHGSITRPLLKADTVNDVCYACHAEKRGPFIWEHAPVRENCLNCHVPHGSNHENLLATPLPFLCQQCHSNTGHPNNLLTRAGLATGPSPDERVMSRSCTMCHAQIHGSNSPAGVQFHR
jgi:DmsE family decaheme c-type cytochrome